MPPVHNDNNDPPTALTVAVGAAAVAAARQDTGEPPRQPEEEHSPPRAASLHGHGGPHAPPAEVSPRQPGVTMWGLAPSDHEVLRHWANMQRQRPEPQRQQQRQQPEPQRQRQHQRPELRRLQQRQLFSSALFPWLDPDNMASDWPPYLQRGQPQQPRNQHGGGGPDARETETSAHVSVSEARQALSGAPASSDEGGGGGDCPICLQGPRDVALTGCGHTLCLSCFAHIWSDSGTHVRGNECTVKCPFCRKPNNCGLHLFNT